MPTIDAQVVLRSGASNAAYGNYFAYAQFLKVGGALGLATGSALLSGVSLLAATEIGRRVLAKRRATNNRKYRRGFSMIFTARYRPAGSTSWQRRVVTRLDYDGSIDQGNALTLAESGLCLLDDRDKFPDNAGVLTAANGLGLPMLNRLQQAGIRFSISERH